MHLMNRKVRHVKLKAARTNKFDVMTAERSVTLA